MSDDCVHADFEFVPGVIHIEGGEGLPPPFTFITLKARCATCHMQFHWRGLPSGKPNAKEPVVSADGYELRAPIAPGPGAVVGLLEQTGQLDKLVSPTTS